MRFTGIGNTYNYGDIIRFPKKARILVVSDIHGNYDDFLDYVNMWKKGGRDTHIIFLGDLIHGLDPKTDGSLDILMKVGDLILNDTFHVLMGNHEWYQINDIPIYKNGVNQTEEFKMICKNYGDFALEMCEDIMRNFKKIAVSPNGLVMAHAGPSKEMNNILRDMKGLTLSPIYAQSEINEAFGDMVFARPNDIFGYTEKDVDQFLENVGGNIMIVGHTPVNG